MRLPVILAALTLAACSGGTPDSSTGNSAGAAGKVAAAAGGARPCAVIDKASVDKVIGRDMGQPATDNTGMCQYLWSGEKPSDQALATLTIHDTTLAALEPGLTEMKAEMEPVTGIGDRAFFAKGYGLYVEHNGRSGIYIAATGLGDDNETANVAMTKQLAEATVDKL